MVNNCTIDCGAHGSCSGTSCTCFYTYTGANCETTFHQALGAQYSAYYYVNIVMWFFTAAFACFMLARFIKKAPFFSMRHLIVVLLCLATIARVADYWACIDGNFDRQEELEPLDGLLFNIYYPFAISAYTCELFVWIELYTATTLTKIEMLPRLRWVFLVINVVIFVVEISYRVAISRNIGSVQNILFTIWLIYMASVVLFESIGFLFLGVKFYRTLMEMTSIGDSAKQFFRRLSFMTFLSTGLLLFGFFVIAFTFVLAKHPETWLYLNWFSRFLEAFLIVIMILTIKPPQTVVHISHSHNSEQEEKKTYSFSIEKLRSSIEGSRSEELSAQIEEGSANGSSEKESDKSED